MPTIIDSLMVRLGMDTKDFDASRNRMGKGLRDTGTEAERTGKKLKGAGKDATDGFNSATSSAVKFLATIGGTALVKNFVQDTIESSAALQRLSMNLQQNVSEISAWSNAAQIAGGSSKGLQGTLSMLSKEQTKLALTGESGLIPYFSALGINMWKGSPTEKLLALSDAFSKLDRTTAFNMGESMGIDEGTMNLLLKGRRELEILVTKQKELSAVTKKQAEESERARVYLVASRLEFEAFGRELLSSAMPALEKVAMWLEKVGQWARDNKEFVQDFLSVLAVGLAAVSAAAMPINLTAAALLGLGAAIALVLDDYRAWKNGGKSEFPWASWLPHIQTLVEWLGKLKDVVYNLGYNFFTKLFGTVDALRAPDNKSARAAYAASSGWFDAAGAAKGGASGNLAVKLANAEAANGLPPGTLSAIMKQETGGSSAYISDPSKYHYAADASGRRIAGHTGKISTAFGPFGLLESTAADPGYGVTPLQNKSLDEQIRFAAEYAAARSRSAGSLAGGLAGYGEGSGYARSVLSGIPGAAGAAMGAGVPSPMTIAGGNKSVETHIGEVKVFTQATDADGIARDMGKSLDYLFTSQVNAGMM